MKNTYLTIATLAIIAVSANAQESLLAGWDFTNVTNYNGVSSLSAEKTDLAADVNAAPYGAVYFDGSFGSTDTHDAGGSNTVYSNNTSGLSNNTSISTRLPAEAFSGNNSLLLDGFTASYPGSVVFAITTGGSYNTWNFSYAGGVGGSSADSVSFDWAYSFDGSNYSTLASDSVSNGDAGFSHASFADSTDSANLYLKLSFTGLNSASAFGDEYALVDNFAVYGAAVPEPSTYAAIAGAFALAFAAYRRRK